MSKAELELIFNLAVTGSRTMSLAEASQLLPTLEKVKKYIDEFDDTGVEKALQDLKGK